MDTKRFSELIKDIYRAVNELEKTFTDETGKKRHFTPDGHMVGSIGEVLARYHYGIELFTASTKTHDGKIGERKVQIKATQGEAILIRLSSSDRPDFLLVLKISELGVAEEIYNGPGDVVWDFVKHKNPPKSDYYRISNRDLGALTKNVADSDKIVRIHP